MRRIDFKNILQEKFFDSNNRIVWSKTKEFSARKILWEELFNLLIELTSFLNVDAKLSHRIFCVMNDILDNPKCDYCKEKNTRFIKYSEWYNKYCSSYCVNHSPEVIQTRINNNLEKYWVTSPTKLESVKDKQKQSMIEKYGDNYSILQLEKRKKTLIKKYGVDNPSKIEDVKRKREQTNTERYGYKSNLLDPKVRKQIKETIKDKYWVDNVSQNISIKAKKSKIALERYWVDNVLKSEEIKNRIKNTNLQKYGVDNPSKSKFISDKIIATWYSRYFNWNANTIEFLSNINVLAKKFNTEIEYKDNEYFVNCNNCNNRTRWTHQFISMRLRQFHITPCEICQPKYSAGASWIENLFWEFISAIYPNEIVYNSRTIIKPLELDIYLPDIKIAIEINWLYWHSEEHKDKNYHYDKMKMCQEKGIQLYQFFEDEIPQAMMLMYSVLANNGVLRSNIDLDDINTLYWLTLFPTAKIYARKTIVKRIPDSDKSIVKNILETYHVQWWDTAWYKYALYDTEWSILSIMTFKKMSVDKNQQKSNNTNMYELSRYVTIPWIQIVWWFSKLINAFKKDLPDVTILTYSNLRYSNEFDNVYNRNNFELQWFTGINYYYFFEWKKMHRFNFRKDNLYNNILPKYGIEVDPDYLKESERWMVEKLNLIKPVRKLFDAWHLKWILK